MHPILDPRTKELIINMPELIKNFKFRKGPDLYFYRKTMELRRKKPLDELFESESDRYLELIYATLVSWDMNSRRAKMKYFDKFKTSILKNKKSLLHLSPYKLDLLSDNEFREVKRVCEKIYSNMHVMESSGKLVSNSKTMHFIVPDLVMPMDRQNTLKFFFGNTGESKSRFLTVFERSHQIAKDIDLEQFLDEEWNLSKPKVIDNAIISYMSPKYNIARAGLGADQII